MMHGLLAFFLLVTSGSHPWIRAKAGPYRTSQASLSMSLGPVTIPGQHGVYAKSDNGYSGCAWGLPVALQ